MNELRYVHMFFIAEMDDHFIISYDEANMNDIIQIKLKIKSSTTLSMPLYRHWLFLHFKIKCLLL